MRTATAVAVLAVLVPSAARAGDPDFKAVVHGMESNLGIHQMRFPLFGLAKGIARIAAGTQGVHQLDFALFEELDYTRPDPARFDDIVRGAVADRWQPFVRVHSRGDREATYIYLRPAGKDWRMLIAEFEEHEAVIVHVKLNPEEMRHRLDDPLGAGREGRRSLFH